MPHRFSLVLLVGLLSAGPAAAAELAVLTDANWARLAPEGKEADCILGDFAFRSDRLQAVVAQPLPTRHANMTVRQVGGAVIDLTVTDRANDQLSAFYPGKRQHVFTEAKIVQAQGKRVVLVCTAPAQPADPKKKTGPQPAVRLEYELEDGRPFLLLRSTFTNPFEEPLIVPLEDDLRFDNVETRVKAGPTDLFWAHDRHFEQAYALLADGHGLRTRSDIRTSVIQYLPAKSEKAEVTLPPGQSYTLTRRLFPGPHLLAVKGAAARFQGRPVVPYAWHVVDAASRPVHGAEIILKQGDTIYGTARTDEQGWARAMLPPEKLEETIKAVGRPTHETKLDLTGVPRAAAFQQDVVMETASQVVAEISDEKGGPVPCKVAFKGIGKTPSPYWGPPSAREAVVNLYYSVTGRFSVPINPGTYEAIISRGPQYDVVRLPLKVERGKPVPLKATLKRAFTTPGWVSTDFHSHSSPSGDNTTDQRGRVLNHICEHIEFAPCTEHNRLDSYVPHLKALHAEHLMGTCTGIELTGMPLPLNHHNAFPLRMKPRTQDGGAPLPDKDPQVQVRRLAEWEGPRAELLVQQNHPDIGWLFFDKDGDGTPDGGYRAGFPYMHVIEVHPIHEVLKMQPDVVGAGAKKGRRYRYNNTVFNWLQLLNQGHRLPGVVNTDAHYNFHGSGGYRNFIRCDAKSPGAIDPLEIVRHARKGHIIMSNGPFLDVTLNDALPGDDLRPVKGRAVLHVRVCCPNWLDVDRVQVLLNGRPDPKLNFARGSHPQLFHDKAQRFEHRIELALERDTHVIVVATNEAEEIGEVAGPFYGRQHATAVSNPIYVDVDGGGFQANGDTLGHPLPVKAGKEVP
jgi:hypothetical protein